MKGMNKMNIKVYLSCCGGDKALETVTEAVRLAGLEVQVEPVQDMAEVARAGIISTPAIKINNRLVASGRIPKVAELVTLLMNAAIQEV
jgi:fatty acid-binding protein DegV